MAKLAIMDGVWRGTGLVASLPGGKHEVVQTERIGPFLGGTVKVIEGPLLYRPTAPSGFNALGIISYNPANGPTGCTAMRRAWRRLPDEGDATAMSGRSPPGPARPSANARRSPTAPGARSASGSPGAAPPMQMFEMNLKRVGDTKLAARPVPMP